MEWVDLIGQALSLDDRVQSFLYMMVTALAILAIVVVMFLYLLLKHKHIKAMDQARAEYDRLRTGLESWSGRIAKLEKDAAENRNLVDEFAFLRIFEMNVSDLSPSDETYFDMLACKEDELDVSHGKIDGLDINSADSYGKDKSTRQLLIDGVNYIRLFNRHVKQRIDGQEEDETFRAQVYSDCRDKYGHYLRRAIFLLKAGVGKIPSSKKHEIAEFNNYIGVAWDKLLDFERAIEAFYSSIENRPRHDKPHYNMAATLAQLRVKLESVTSVEAPIRIKINGEFRCESDIVRLKQWCVTELERHLRKSLEYNEQNYRVALVDRDLEDIKEGKYGIEFDHRITEAARFCHKCKTYQMLK